VTSLLLPTSVVRSRSWKSRLPVPKPTDSATNTGPAARGLPWNQYQNIQPLVSPPRSRDDSSRIVSNGKPRYGVLLIASSRRWYAAAAAAARAGSAV